MKTPILLPNLSANIPVEISKHEIGRSLAALEWTEPAAPDSGVNAEARCVASAVHWVLSKRPAMRAGVVIARKPWNAGTPLADKLGAWAAVPNHGASDANILTTLSGKISVGGHTTYIGFGSLSPIGIGKAWNIARSFGGLLIISSLGDSNILDKVLGHMRLEGNAEIMPATMRLVNAGESLFVWAFPVLMIRP